MADTSRERCTHGYLYFNMTGQSSHIRVAAIIVTYNRKTLLERCIASIRAQSIPCDIFIIDNASIDLEYNAFTQDPYINNPHFFYIRLEENRGSAGGFAHGLRIAGEGGYDWCWTMDDDGFADPGCLARLLDAPHHTLCRTPLLLNASQQNSLLYPILISDRRYQTKAEIQQIQNTTIEDQGFLWNGVLLHMSLVKKIGLPDERLFIWGDETEYTLRIQKYGFKKYMIINALFYHPRSVDMWNQAFFKKISFLSAPSDRLYCYYRNYFTIHRNYYSPYKHWRWMIVELLKRILAGKWRDIAIITRGFFDAMCGVWGRERYYFKSPNASREV